MIQVVIANLLASRQAGSRRERTRPRGLSVETLEGRQLLSGITTGGAETTRIAKVVEIISLLDDSGDDPPITQPELPRPGPLDPVHPPRIWAV